MAPKSFSDILLTRSFVAAICSGVKFAPTTGSADVGGVGGVALTCDGDAVAVAVAAPLRLIIVFLEASIISSSKYSWISFHTRSNPARSTLLEPKDPSSQHSFNSLDDKSSSDVPDNTVTGGSVAKALNVTPPVGGVDINSAALNMVSITLGSCELPSKATGSAGFSSTTASTTSGVLLVVAAFTSIFNISAAASTCSGDRSFIALAATSTCSGVILDICSWANRLCSASCSGVILDIIFCACSIICGFSFIIFIDFFIRSGSIPMALSCEA
mmetsp:Transcript_1367/g.2168  ORF Transcript_1367/g.2168 Transcript_1367/m.2168 type:complete len:272 (-) Transcript_1367:257-1072(-)